MKKVILSSALVMIFSFLLIPGEEGNHTLSAPQFYGNS